MSQCQVYFLYRMIVLQQLNGVHVACMYAMLICVLVLFVLLFFFVVLGFKNVLYTCICVCFLCLSHGPCCLL